MPHKHISNRRDLFNNDHSQAGKGDKPRTPLNENYRRNFDAINWSGWRALQPYELVEPGDQFQRVTGEWRDFDTYIGQVFKGNFPARTRADRPVNLQFNPNDHEQTK